LMLSSDQKASDALPIFASGVRRIALTSVPSIPHEVSPGVKELELAGICSQSDLIRFVSTQFAAGKCEADAAVTVEQAGLLRHQSGKGDVSPVLSVSQQSFVAHAILRIVNSGVEALAVVDTNGSLVGSFSASDLRFFFTMDDADKDISPSDLLLARLAMTVGAYLEKWSPRSLVPLCVLPHDTMAHVLAAMNSFNVHHAFVTSGPVAGSIPMNQKQLVALVTHTDICRWLLGDTSGARAGAQQQDKSSQELETGGLLSSTTAAQKEQ